MLLGFSLLSFLQGLKKEILVLNCHFLLCLLLYGPHSHSQHHFVHCLCFLHPELKTYSSSWRDENFKKLLDLGKLLPPAGLSLRAGGRGFPPVIMSVIPLLYLPGNLKSW